MRLCPLLFDLINSPLLKQLLKNSTISAYSGAKVMTAINKSCDINQQNNILLCLNVTCEMLIKILIARAKDGWYSNIK